MLDDSFDKYAGLALQKIDLTNSEKNMLLLTGDWDQAMVETMAQHIDKMKARTLMVVVPGDLKLESMPIAEFYGLMKACEKQMGLTPEGDGVSGD